MGAIGTATGALYRPKESQLDVTSVSTLTGSVHTTVNASRRAFTVV